jgi:hypothetical protein
MKKYILRISLGVLLLVGITGFALFGNVGSGLAGAYTKPAGGMRVDRERPRVCRNG